MSVSFVGTDTVRDGTDIRKEKQERAAIRSYGRHPGSAAVKGLCG